MDMEGPHDPTASEDFALGREAGLKEGRTGGLRDGKHDGRKAGKMQGLKEGEAVGFEKGKAEGVWGDLGKILHYFGLCRSLRLGVLNYSCIHAPVDTGGREEVVPRQEIHWHAGTSVWIPRNIVPLWTLEHMESWSQRRLTSRGKCFSVPGTQACRAQKLGQPHTSVPAVAQLPAYESLTGLTTQIVPSSNGPYLLRHIEPGNLGPPLAPAHRHTIIQLGLPASGMSDVDEDLPVRPTSDILHISYSMHALEFSLPARGEQLVFGPIAMRMPVERDAQCHIAAASPSGRYALVVEGKQALLSCFGYEKTVRWNSKGSIWRVATGEWRWTIIWAWSWLCTEMGHYVSSPTRNLRL
ncbi:hypothetical protein B0H14DRAFT_2573849 [Mycena olivaceomarginata]|nr:hypothetical protein B0H14DRAFT_2573849 [Mycena olivaceomarginata]